MNIPLGQWSGSDATRELTQNIISLNAAANRQNRSMIRLTWAIAIMTLVMLVGVAVQIWIVGKVSLSDAVAVAPA